MSTPWESFVARAIHGEPDEPFLALLRKRLAGGYQVVRVSFERTSKGPAYIVLLSHLRQLSKMEVPHSPSFTRWSLANGIRMVSVEEEEERWALVAGERLQAIADDFGADYANLIFLERVRALGPPRTTRALAGEAATRTAPGREQTRALREMNAFLEGLAADLVGALGYSEEAAGILDGALERFAREMFQLDLAGLWHTSESEGPGLRPGGAPGPGAFRRAGATVPRGGRTGR